MMTRRRTFLRLATLLGGGLALSACSPAPVTPTPGASPVLPGASPLPSAPPLPSSVPSASPSPALVPAISGSPSAVAQSSPAALTGGSGVNAAWVILAANQMLFPLALQAGYFAKYGVDLNLSYINGSNNGLAGLASHSLDLITASGPALITAQTSGIDVVMVLGIVNRSLYRVMATPDIQSSDDLKGQPISTGIVGSASDYFYWVSLAKYLGWSPSDLNCVGQTDDTSAKLAMLQTGVAKATAVSPPQDIQAADAGAHMVFDSATIDLPDEQSGIIVTRDYLASHHDLLVNVARACVEGIHRWKTDEQFTGSIFASYFKSDDPRVAQSGWSSMKDALQEQPFPSREGILNDVPPVVAQRPEAANLSVDNIMDNSIVQELVDSGFIQQVYGA